MKVLQVIPDLGVGGAERMVCDLALGLIDRGHDVRILSFFNNRSNHIVRRLQDGGVVIEELDKKLGPDARIPYRCAAAIKRLQPDVVHSHRYALRYLAWAARTRSPPKFIHTVHSGATTEVKRGTRVLHRRLYRSGRVLPIAVAESMVPELISTYGVQRVDVVHNGVDPASSVSGPDRAVERLLWRQQHGVGANDILSLFVGRLSDEKDPLGALEIFDRARQKLPDCRLAFIGDGPLRGVLEEQVHGLGAESQVSVLGERNDVRSCMAAADVLLITSRYEGAPLAALEAMAEGLCVVATQVGALPELLGDGQYGCLVARGDVRAASETFASVVTDDRRRGRYQAAASARSKRYSVEEMVRGYERLYERH